MVGDDLLTIGETDRALVNPVEGLRGKEAGVHVVIELNLLNGRSNSMAAT